MLQIVVNSSIVVDKRAFVQGAFPCSEFSRDIRVNLFSTAMINSARFVVSSEPLELNFNKSCQHRLGMNDYYSLPAITRCLSTTNRQFGHLQSFHLHNFLWLLSVDINPWFLQRAHLGVLFEDSLSNIIFTSLEDLLIKNLCWSLNDLNSRIFLSIFT